MRGSKRSGLSISEYSYPVIVSAKQKEEDNAKNNTDKSV
jgi:hypothetical protein